MNKRGDVIGESLYFIAIPFVILLFFVLFFLFLQFDSNLKQEIASYQTNTNTLRLIGLLRSPAGIDRDDGKYSISDLVIYSAKKNDFGVLKNKIKEEMDAVYNDRSCPGSWKLVGKSVDGKELFSVGELNNRDLAIFNYHTFFEKVGVGLVAFVYKYEPVGGSVVLPVDTKNVINLTLYVEC